MSDTTHISETVHECLGPILRKKAEVEVGLVLFLDDIRRAEAAGAATERDRVNGLDTVIALLDECLGCTTRDTNRACYQAAQMVGVKYDRFHHILKRVRLRGIRAAPEFAGEMRFNTPMGSVYVAHERDGDRIKVGYSRDPDVRIAHLSRATGIDLVEYLSIPGFPITETSLHVCLRPAWLGGEWYSAEALSKCRQAVFDRKAAA